MWRENRFTAQIVHPDNTVTFIAPYEPERRKRRRFCQTIPHVASEEILQLGKQAKLPILGTISRIVGWGAYSVGLQISSLINQTHVIVLKQLRDDLTIPDIDSPRSDIQSLFEPYSTPSWLAIGHGINNEPALLKISKEVVGPTLSAMSILEILSDSQLLTHLCEIYARSLNYFMHTGELPDITGFRSKNRFFNLINELIPYKSKNIVVAYGSDKPAVVDVGAIMEKAKTKNIDILRLGILAIKTIGYAETLIISKVALMCHKIREKIVTQPIDNAIEADNFRAEFSNIIRFLERKNIDYRVVGHFALAGWIKKFGGDYTLPSKRQNRTTRDVDIIVLGVSPVEAKTLASECKKEMAGKAGSPEVTFSAVYTGENTKPAHMLTRHSYNYHTGGGGLSKKYGEDEISFNEHEMSPTVLEFFDVRFKSFPVETIAALYLSRGGGFKMKDLIKLHTLFELSNFRLDERWITFTENIQKNNKLNFLTFQIMEFIDFWAGGYISVVRRKMKPNDDRSSQNI